MATSPKSPGRTDTRGSGGGSPLRRPFLAYGAEILQALLDHARLAAGGRPVRPTHLRLRSLHDGSLGHDLTIALPPPGGTAGRGLVGRHLAALNRLTIPMSGPQLLIRGAWRSRLDAEAGAWTADHAGDGDFPFAFPAPPARPPASTAEYAARCLAILLDAFDLLRGEETLIPDEVEADGRGAAVALASPHDSVDLGPRLESEGLVGIVQPLFAVAATEPTIATLARHWGLAASAVELDGREHAIDGFRLARAADWVVPSRCHPSEIYEHLARVCNVACEFCYLFGNPDDLAVARAKKTIHRDELRTRLRHYRPDSGEALFHAQWELNEFLVDPKLPALLGELRGRTDDPFFFTTNGNPLTPRLVDQLAAVKPVHLIVSTNTVDEPLRGAVMKERSARTRTAFSALAQLRDHELPFGVSVVASPDFSLAQLEETIFKVAETDPCFVRVNLPGFTRDHPYQLDFDTDALWPEVVEWARDLRAVSSVPLLIVPSAYEMNFFEADPHLPRLIGVVPGSPAQQAGLRAGDVVTRVGALDIEVRGQLGWSLLLMQGRFEVDVLRDGQPLTVEIDPEAGRYPYTGPLIGKYVFPHGFMAAPGLSATDAGPIEEALDGGGDAWLLTSPLMAPAARAFLERFTPGLVDRVEVVVVENRFLGGNIRVLDMATVSDIAHALADASERLGRPLPQRLLLPASGFNRHGRDLAGRHWADLERWHGVEVHLLAATTSFVY